MFDDNSIMKYETTLPENFDGNFYFTNSWEDEDFVGKWGSKEYVFPAHSTSKMLMPELSPLEVQQVRKKFAKDWAQLTFFKGKQYEHLRLREGVKDEMGMITPRGYGMSHAGTYSIDELTPYIQMCLAPLPTSQTITRAQTRVRLEEKLSTNEDGELNSAVIKTDKDLADLAKGKTALDKRVMG